MAKIYTDSTMERGDFGKGYPPNDRFLFMATQNFELEMQQIRKNRDRKRRENSELEPEIARPAPVKAAPKAVKEEPIIAKEESQKPKPAGRRVVRKQIPQPTK